MEFMNIIGHQKIINFLDRSIEKNALSHAYIFSGPEHLGKFGVALDFARKLTNSESEINPDLIVVKPDEKDIKIEQIRELQQSLSLTSHFGKYRAAIIDDAEKMNKAAQNAMLKTLEEPMEKIILILIIHDLGKILPTIKSRCALEKFAPVSPKEIEKMLPDNLGNREEIIFWSLGRPGLLKIISENTEELANRKEAEKELLGLFKNNVSEKFALAEKMSKDAPNLGEKLDWWTVLLRESLFGEKKPISLNPQKIVNLLDRIGRSRELLRETNSNARLVLENLLLEM